MVRWRGWRCEGAEVAGVPLEIVALAGAAVVLAGVAAVRVSSRLGLPSLLLYLGIGVAIGEAGLGLRFDDAAPRPDPRPGRARRDPHRGRADHPVDRGPPGRRRSPSCCPRSGSRSASRSPPPPPSCCWTPAGGPGSCSARSSRSTDAAAVFSTLRALRLPARLTATLEMESGFNDAPVVILVTLLSSGADRLPGRVVAAGHLPAGGRRRDRAGRRLRRAPGCCAAGRCRPPGSTRCRSSPSPSARTRWRRRARLRLPRRVPDRAGAGQRAPAAPARHPRLRRGAGLAGPDRPVRAARAAGQPEPARPRRCCRRWASARRCCCWPGRCRCSPSRGLVPGALGASRCSCPGPGCAARCRSCWPPSR